jgi:hypothetical protein
VGRGSTILNFRFTRGIPLRDVWFEIGIMIHRELKRSYGTGIIILK